MATQSISGKAFEYACLLALYNTLIENQVVEVEDTAPLQTARKSYESLDSIVKKDMEDGANAAVRTLLRLEPQLLNPENNIPLILAIQKDSSGEAGDVRDVLAIRQQNNWEIGISVKHNHDAVKHSRLSQTIDFGGSWFDTPCSSNYFEEIRPIFDELSELREQKVKWRDLENKEERFYIPVLNAFIKEINALYSEHGSVIPNQLLLYLLGRHDFYKLIADSKRRVTKLQAFSFSGTLNNPAGNVQPMYRIPRMRLPEIIYSTDFKPGSKTTINIACNEGWELSARIHNASTMVEPSLKFDIKLVGLPPTVYSHDEPWGLFGVSESGGQVAEQTDE